MAYRPTEKTEARRLSQHQLLLDSAMRLVAQSGFQTLTVQALADHAGVAIGTVYKYFDSKAALCAEVFCRGTEKEIEKVRAAAFPNEAKSCQRRLLDVIKIFSERAIQGHRLAYALIGEPIDPLVEAERLKYRRAYAEIFAKLLDEGITQGEFRPQNTEIASAALVGVLSEALVGPLGLGGPEVASFNPQQLIEGIQAFCLRAVIKDGARKFH